MPPLIHFHSNPLLKSYSLSFERNSILTVFCFLRYTSSFRSIPDDVIIVVVPASHILCYFNSVVNPFIYNFMSGKILYIYNQYNTDQDEKSLRSDKLAWL